ncbi:hypothetical protein MN116_001704 [Schistosoma mekongi]|uniref:UV radiation resistance-associated gene protein n=1 Tax=Schistosoma mekongi TaxID=38744 RepID=A0AAE1ZHW3_SCHME|nr:hypothetical protein MN116_001704 [Schistosoma mekongi]
MSPVILRLRHLRAVYGKNFSVFDDGNTPTATGITFALSSVNQDNIGYYYISDIASDLQNPEWDPVEMHSIPNHYSSSKAVLFTFFLAHKESNSILFEILVNFSGLVLTDLEMRESMRVPDLKDQVYFQMGSHMYAVREYFNDGFVYPQLCPKNSSRHVPRLSYNFATLQKFLVNKEASKVQLKRITYMQTLANGLQSSLHNLFSQGVTTEKVAVAIDSVKRRTETLKCSVSLARSKIRMLESKRFFLEQESSKLDENRVKIANRLEVLKKSLLDGYDELHKTRCTLFIRTLHLLNEVYCLFINDLIGPVCINQEINLNDITNSATIENDHSSNNFPNDYLYINDSLSFPLDGIELSSNKNAHSHSTHHIDYGMDTYTSPICFTYIAHLFTLIAAILDQPIIYPKVFTEHYPKLKLLDIFTRDLSQSDRCLAICILNRNIFSLGSRFNLCLKPEKHALYNLKFLFEHFQNSKFTDKD